MLCIRDRYHLPEMSVCINAMRVLTEPAETGAATLCLPQDVSYLNISISRYGVSEGESCVYNMFKRCSGNTETA